MEEINKTYVFQVDSNIVQQAYIKQNNFLIEYDDKGDKNWCAIYFCSNDIYYPNTEEIFRKRIVEKNFFEWYHSRINKASKHIFVRDIFKQWYFMGISAKINTPEKLTEFLRKETKGYNIVTVGSSAGGYAAILYGSLLNAKYTITFNPQFELLSLMKRSSEKKNPILFRTKDEKFIYHDISTFININTKIFYFYSKNSEWDKEENLYIGKKHSNLYKIAFHTKHHGIPFLKVALQKVINLQPTDLERLAKTNHFPILFTIRMVGILKTINGIYIQLKKRL